MVRWIAVISRTTSVNSPLEERYPVGCALDRTSMVIGRNPAATRLTALPRQWNPLGNGRRVRGEVA